MFRCRLITITLCSTISTISAQFPSPLSLDILGSECALVLPGGARSSYYDHTLSIFRAASLWVFMRYKWKLFSLWIYVHNDIKTMKTCDGVHSFVGKRVTWCLYSSTTCTWIYLTTKFPLFHFIYYAAISNLSYSLWCCWNISPVNCSATGRNSLFIPFVH